MKTKTGLGSRVGGCSVQPAAFIVQLIALQNPSETLPLPAVEGELSIVAPLRISSLGVLPGWSSFKSSACSPSFLKTLNQLQYGFERHQEQPFAES